MKSVTVWITCGSKREAVELITSSTLLKEEHKQEWIKMLNAGSYEVDYSANLESDTPYTVFLYLYGDQPDLVLNCDTFSGGLPGFLSGEDEEKFGEESI